MKCMHENHDGSASRLIFVPEKIAKGHNKIKGPLICDICYYNEFKKSDWLPEDIWIQPEGSNSPRLLVKELPSSVPKSKTAMDIGLNLFTAGLANLFNND